jgi:hypothetical protein
MYLLYGVVSLSITVLLFSITLLGVRNPVRPFWAKESIVANVLTPLMLGFFLLGISYITKEVMTGVQSGFSEWTYAALTVAATVAIIKMLGIRKKLAVFASATKNGEIIEVDFLVNRLDEHPHDSSPKYRKAA